MLTPADQRYGQLVLALASAPPVIQKKSGRSSKQDSSSASSSSTGYHQNLSMSQPLFPEYDDINYLFKAGKKHM